MEKLTVIGSGTMGHSITLSAAWAGINVNMYGLTEQHFWLTIVRYCKWHPTSRAYSDHTLLESNPSCTPG